jgi:hypothetical protein
MKQSVSLRLSLLMAIAIVPALIYLGCGGGSNPTNPTPSTTLPPVTTTPTTTLNPAAACGAPVPPPIAGMRINVQLVTHSTRWQIDSRPVVENIDGYCVRTGQGNGRYCDTRPEGHLEREACDALVVGRAKDTNRLGPTWYWNDQSCRPSTIPQEAGCTNHPDNQFLAIARGGGRYLACAADGTCGGCELRPGDELCR